MQKHSKKEKLLTVTSNYNLNLSQNEIEFVDVPLELDLPCFINPFAIKNSKDKLIMKMSYLLNKHFKHMLDLIKDSKQKEALMLIEGFSEKNTRGIHLGYSTDKNGKSIGPEKAKAIYNAFNNSVAVKTGKLNDIEECTLLLENVSYDIISDIILSICKKPLLEFTINQSKKYSLKTRPFNIKVLNENSKWVYKEFNLPYNFESKEDYILLVPKNIVIHNPKLTNARAYSFIWEKLKYSKNITNKELNLALVMTLDDNILEKPTTKKEFKNSIPESKEIIVKFFGLNPNQLKLIMNRYNLIGNSLYDANAEIANAYNALFKRFHDIAA
ncbi:hypothetical protein [Clostridium tetani]|uniref:hypothetical protein n=1 Tax=Clostridium tetani TaxID=1513 RepID=UPI0010257EF9|nr:hypothetical protein [Clostridium tetani]RXI67519.1 hypothetical protein DP127_14205 [Clostridium tetani]BDR84439.1 hypothetical protein K254310026_18500 [Clostridium tetani]